MDRVSVKIVTVAGGGRILVPEASAPGDWRENMKDLKHLIYFENLLQEAQNELILQAQSEGKVCVAYVCENTPEPLLNLPGAFSARLRAPRTCPMEMATYFI